MSWWDGRIGCFDLETTGVDPEEARIVSSTIATVGAGRDPDDKSFIVNPWVPIPPGASEVHGITDEVARFTGVPAELAVAAIVESLRAFVLRGWPLVIFNARYDLTVVDREARRHGVEPLDLTKLRVIDPLVIDKHVHRYRPGSRKLAAACEHYGARLDTAHDAASDAVAAARLAWRICKQAVVIRRARDEWEQNELNELSEEWDRVRGDLDLLFEAQVRWSHEQSTGIAGYFREQAARCDREGKGEDRDELLAKAARAEVEQWPMTPFGVQSAEQRNDAGASAAVGTSRSPDDGFEAAKSRLFS